MGRLGLSVRGQHLGAVKVGLERGFPEVTQMGSKISLTFEEFCLLGLSGPLCVMGPKNQPPEKPKKDSQYEHVTSCLLTVGSDQ